MKNKPIRFSILLIAIALSSCQNMPKKIVNKYDIYISENKLAPIKKIINFSFRGWNSLDNQHFALSASHNKSYLIKLYNYCNNLDFSTSIKLNQSMDNILSSNFDSISIPNQNFQDKCRIKNIYPLSQQQVKEINSL